MGRKKKYATPEEALKAQYARRTKTFIFSEKLNLIKESVEAAPKLLEKIFDRSKDTYDWCEFDPSDVYFYAIIGVDATIDALYRIITMKTSQGETQIVKSDKAGNYAHQTNRLVLLANQLRFRSWLYDKLELSAKLSRELTEDEKPKLRVPTVAELHNRHIRHRRTKAEIEAERNKANQINQTELKEELNNVDSVAFTESDSEQEGTL